VVAIKNTTETINIKQVSTVDNLHNGFVKTTGMLSLSQYENTLGLLAAV